MRVGAERSASMMMRQGAERVLETTRYGVHSPGSEVTDMRRAAWLLLALTTACGARVESVAGSDAGAEAAGGSPPPISPPVTLASGQNTPQAIAVNDSVVAWGNYASGHGDGSVVVVGLDGGSPITIASSAQPGAIALDSTSVYWDDWVTGLLMKAPLDGGAPTTLATAAGPSRCRAATSTGFTTAASRGCPRAAVQSPRWPW